MMWTVDFDKDDVIELNVASNPTYRFIVNEADTTDGTDE